MRDKPQRILRIVRQFFAVKSQELMSLEHFIYRDNNERLSLLKQLVVLVDLAVQINVSDRLTHRSASHKYL